MTRLVLIRHAPTADTGKRLTGRLPGVPLTPAGRRAATALARRLTAIELEAIYTSPALRCRQTAAPLAAAHRLRPAVRHDLADTDYGEWAGRTLAGVRRTASWRLVLSSPSRARFPGGEALAAVQARSVGVCEGLAALHPAGVVALVTHADVIATALAHYLGMPLDCYARLAPAPASVTTVDLPGNAPARIIAVGVTAEDG